MLWWLFLGHPHDDIHQEIFTKHLYRITTLAKIKPSTASYFRADILIYPSTWFLIKRVCLIAVLNTLQSPNHSLFETLYPYHPHVLLCFMNCKQKILSSKFLNPKVFKGKSCGKGTIVRQYQDVIFPSAKSCWEEGRRKHCSKLRSPLSSCSCTSCIHTHTHTQTELLLSATTSLYLTETVKDCTPIMWPTLGTHPWLRGKSGTWRKLSLSSVTDYEIVSNPSFYFKQVIFMN